MALEDQDPHHPAVCLLVHPQAGGLGASADWAGICNLLGRDGPFRLQAGRAVITVDPDPLAATRPGPAALRALQERGPWAVCTPETAAVGWPVAAPEGWERLLERILAGAEVSEAHTGLVDAATDVWLRPGFETLLSHPQLRFVPFPHQVAAATTVLRRMHGRALLADEVGLGKTIEAGLILTELYLRRQASRTLILVPSGLVRQWAEELERKFALPCLIHGSTAWQSADDPWAAPIVLASLATARRSPHNTSAGAVPWDLVIVDEAHRLKNPRSASAQLVKSLQTRYLLLLTATPVENRLDELYHLVNLLRPGHLGTPTQFRRQYGAATNAATVRNLPTLQQQMREIMVRHRRSEVAVMLPRRLAETRRVHAAPGELELYAQVSDHVRAAGQAAAPAERMALRSLQRLAGSSPAALARGLERMEHPPAAVAGAVPRTAKLDALLSILEHHLGQAEKVVVFTGFRATLEMLGAALSAAGIDAALYHGGLGRRDKDAVISAFQGPRPVLLTTEAAGEGRNLQFCHVMVNFDLPWNPMQIEQRLGRIHRIGQERDVILHNLVTRGTLEDHILSVLESKINLFELVVGELDMILGRIDDDFDFEQAVFDEHVHSRDDADFAARLEDLGTRLADARRGYLKGRSDGDAWLPTEDEEAQ